MSPFRRTVRLYVSVFFKAGQTYDQPRLFPNVAGAGNGAFSARQPVTDVTGICSAESGEEFDFPGAGMVIVGIVREDFIRQDLFRIGCPHHLNPAGIPVISAYMFSFMLLFLLSCLAQEGPGAYNAGAMPAVSFWCCFKAPLFSGCAASGSRP